MSRSYFDESKLRGFFFIGSDEEYPEGYFFPTKRWENFMNTFSLKWRCRSVPAVVPVDHADDGFVHFRYCVNENDESFGITFDDLKDLGGLRERLLAWRS